VRLANDKVIGKALVIGPDSDREQMTNDSKALLSKGRPLAASALTVRDLNKSVQEIDATDSES
jgi:hypothetical protein